MRLEHEHAERARGAIAHELRTPLSVIVGYAELLRTRDSDELRLEAATGIIEAAERLGRAVDVLVGRLGEDDDDSKPEPRREAPRLRILLVDDDDAVRNLLRLTFPVDEFEILEAANGGSALELVAQASPDLVVLDWQLPGLSGADVLAQLKARTPPPRVLVLTADRKALGESAAADAFLTKPFSPVELLDWIERLLGREA